MRIALSEEHEALRSELREYFARLVTPERRTALAMASGEFGDAEVYKDVIREVGRDGWLGIGWPEEYGGQARSMIEQLIFTDEAAVAGVPIPYLTLNTVGPTIMRFGTDVQKREILPKILTGDMHFSIGYSEPESGTDLASLKTRARLEGPEDNQEWVINGQKMWTSLIQYADYIWLACRTGAPDSRHRGISMLIVDTADPGFSWTPIITCDGAYRVNATYYSDVRVPADMLVGEENAGWKLITTQLNHERVMLGPAGRMAGLYSRVQQWAGQPGPDGTAPISKSDVQRALGEIHAYWRLNELLNWQVASSTADAVAIADASATKVFATERIQRIGRLVDEVVGRHGDPADPATAELMSWLDLQIKRNLVITFGGGVNEVMRELIATAGLKLPRVPR